MPPTPRFFVSADSTGVTGEFSVSADSKGVISPLFPADPRGACKCGLQRSCGRGVMEVRIVKDLAKRWGAKNEELSPQRTQRAHRGGEEGEGKERQLKVES